MEKIEFGFWELEAVRQNQITASEAREGSDVHSLLKKIAFFLFLDPRNSKRSQDENWREAQRIFSFSAMPFYTKVCKFDINQTAKRELEHRAYIFSTQDSSRTPMQNWDLALDDYAKSAIGDFKRNFY